MKLAPASHYTVRLLRQGTSDKDPLCEVIVSGRATGKVIPGAVFGAALQWRDYVLLFVTDDVMFEESLRIYLLDQHLNIADHAMMYFMYSTGIFSNLDLSTDDTVRFNFLGDWVWSLRLYHEKKFTIPILSTPVGVHRPWTFFRRFEISRLSQRQETLSLIGRSADDHADLKQ